MENRFAVLLAGDEVQVLDGATRDLLWSRPLPAPRAARTAFTGGGLAWSPDGRWLAAACAGRGVVAWRLDTGEKFAPAEFASASEVQWMPDGQRLLVRTPNGWFTLAVQGGKSVQFADENAVWAGGLDGDRLGHIAPVGGAPHFFATAADAQNPALDIALAPVIDTVRCCALSADRTQLAVGGGNGAVLWLDTRTGRAGHPPAAHSGPVQALGWHPDGTRLVSTGADGTCRIFQPGAATQNWMVEHRLPAAIVAAGWSGDGARLLLAAAAGPLKIFDATSALAREQRVPPAPAAPTLAARLRRACAWLEEHPDEADGWRDFAQLVQECGGENAPVLLAAADLGERAVFTRAEDAPLPGQPAATVCHGETLPRTVLVAQACVLGRWEEVVALSTGREDCAGAAWLALAKAEALAHLGRPHEAEAANLEAWQALRQQHGGAESAARTGDRAPGVDLAPWANCKLNEDWAAGENNDFRDLPATVGLPDGVTFHCHDFIQLAGQIFRFSTGHMLPRSTGWMPLAQPGREIHFALAATDTRSVGWRAGTCIGSLFLQRADGGAVRIPLIYGRNIWDWWVPSRTSVPEPPPEPPSEALVWQGGNPHAGYYGRHVALFRLRWAAEAGDSPITAVSLVSSLRRPVPLLMAAEAKP